MACVPIAVWGRSLIVDDEVHFKRSGTKVRILSKHGRIALGLLRSETDDGIPDYWVSESFKPGNVGFPATEWTQWLGYLDEGGDPDEFSTRNCLENMGFEFSFIRREMRDKTFAIWTIPYGAIFYPLTLLSAWLLLSKLRKNVTSN